MTNNSIFSISLVSCPSFVSESSGSFISLGDINTDLVRSSGSSLLAQSQSEAALPNETIHISLTLG